MEQEVLESIIDCLRANINGVSADIDNMAHHRDVLENQLIRLERLRGESADKNGSA